MANILHHDVGRARTETGELDDGGGMSRQGDGTAEKEGEDRERESLQLETA
jgi:hypothetical protein